MLGTDRYLVVSADTHCGATAAVMREYLDANVRDDFDTWNAQMTTHREGMFRMFSTNPDPTMEEVDDARVQRFVQYFDDLDGYSEPSRWLRDQESEGVVASAIYPSGRGIDGVPFGDRPDADELSESGMRAYNRWLGDFCASIDGRGAGLAAVASLHNVELAVDMIREAAMCGLRGIILPDMSPNHPAFHHPMYDPVWSACSEFNLSLNIHGSTTGPAMFTPAQLSVAQDTDTSYRNPFDGVSLQAALADGGVGNRRMMFTFVYGGVLDRFPTLRVAFTEAFLEWVPFERVKLAAPFSELWYNNRTRRQPRQQLKKHPDEYWEDHFFFGASFMAPREAPLRHQIGIGQIMWGSDYPHAEGTWPDSVASLRNTFAGVPADDLRPMLGENAARLYGFDIDHLRSVAERVGPTVDTVAEPIDVLPDSFTYAFR